MIRKIDSNMWYCLPLCFIHCYRETKSNRKLFVCEFKLIIFIFVDLSRILGRRTFSPTCCLVVFSAYMTFLSNHLQTIPISLHNLIEGFKFLNIIGQFTLSCNLCCGSPFSDNVCNIHNFYLRVE